MSANRAALEKAINHGEQKEGSVEFKEQLSKETHLAGNKRSSLVAQLRHRVLSGDGEATYVLGVNDSGEITGIPPERFGETMDVLALIAEEADARIGETETWDVEDSDERRLVGLATVHQDSRLETDDNHIVVGTAGHVDHGKSTLVGSLVTGDADDGDGGLREYLDVKPHEAERGLSADLSYAVYGFDEEQNTLHTDNPNRKSDRSGIVEEADRLVSFVDTVGHEPWLRTTIRGLVGQRLDYGLLTIAADDGPTDITREHLGILLATELPTIVAITKSDMVDDERLDEVNREVESMLREVGRTPLNVRRHGVDSAVEEIDETVVPVVETSSVTMDGLDQLDELFMNLPKQSDNDGSFQMYIDRTYNIEGVGAVASGTIKSGSLNAGDELLIGPFPDGSFRETKARSIEIHYHRVDEAHAGQLISVALKNIGVDEVERGMVLLPRDSDPCPVREFEAELMVLNHPTRINDGYEPVIHVDTVSEVASIHPQGEQLLPGSTGAATIKFKFNPHYLSEGQRFLFREGKSKGVGTITDVTYDT